MRRFVVFILSFIVLLNTPTLTANGVVNGMQVIGSDYVVTLLPNGKNGEGYCTGVYFSERVVITAAHCVIKSEGRAPELKFALENFYVSRTGINYKDYNAKGDSVRVLKIWTEPDYFNRWNSEKNQKETIVNDIAFLFLEKPLVGMHVSRAATRAEFEEFKGGSGKAFHIGYGCIGGTSSSTLIYDGSPYRVDGIIGTSRTYPEWPSAERFLVIDYPTGTSLCPGDSGSALLMQRGEEVLFLGTIFGGTGWLDVSGNLNAKGGEATITVFWPFQVKLDSELSKFIETEKAKAETEKAKAETEAKASAELTAKQEAEAKAKAAADLKANQEAAAKAAAAKKTTITCAKGKLTKKVTAVKPKCPIGFKKK